MHGEHYLVSHILESSWFEKCCIQWLMFWGELILKMKCFGFQRFQVNLISMVADNSSYRESCNIVSKIMIYTDEDAAEAADVWQEDAYSCSSCLHLCFDCKSLLYDLKNCTNYFYGMTCLYLNLPCG